ncbi:hypothetical protein CIB48_g7196 [Xylaria polymorpha]|nr:hypothetical protein CIB48_g7196 [Xylaria polymorpha]
MQLKRKRSESELSTSTTSTFNSPRRFGSISPPSADVSMDTDNFAFTANFPVSPLSRFSNENLHFPHVAGRTMKRFRDNRPSEREVHQRTLNMLFAAQRQQNPSQPHEMSQPQHHVPVGAQPGPSSSLSPSHQTSLHSFWNLPSRPSASAESLPSITVDTPTECEDCGQNFGGDDDDAMMDVDDISAPEGSSCGACGKHVCSHCSITNIGQQRRARIYVRIRTHHLSMKFAYITLFAANTTIPLTSESESNYSAGSDSSGAGLNETHQDLEPEQLMGPDKQLPKNTQITMSSSSAVQAPPRPPKKTVLVTGAGGYIGFAVSRAFARAGWDVYGLIRRADAADALLAEEITPIIGAISADLSFLDAFLSAPTTRALDVVVSCTEQLPFDTDWEHVSAVITKVAHHYHAKGNSGKPLVLVSSGCKDYGQTSRHGEAGLTPHVETSPLNPDAFLATRTQCTLQVFSERNKALYDAAVVRPTPLFGYGGSYYGVLLEAARLFRDSATQLKVPGDAANIYHGCHVDDCAEAYTVGEILSALAAEYGIRGGIVTAPLAEVAQPELRALAAVLSYTQWVDSAKIRDLTGWTDKRRLFSDNTRAYRLAYEAAARAGDAGVKRISERVAGWAALGLSFEKK